MTHQHRSATEQASQEAVIEYLKRHPDFFIRHPTLLAQMEIAQPKGPTVSLTERQLGVLREENRRLQRQLDNLIMIAKENEKLNQRIQRLVVSLSGSESADEFFSNLYDILQNEFNSDTVVIRLFGLPSPSLAGRQEFVEYDAQVFALFEDLLTTSQPVCGRLPAEQATFLFDKEKISSAVLIPLGIPKPQGMLAIGSKEVSRFHADMGTDLLKYMGELISQLLSVWLRR
jgi:hypothetical protein